MDKYLVVMSKYERYLETRIFFFKWATVFFLVMGAGILMGFAQGSPVPLTTLDMATLIGAIVALFGMLAWFFKAMYAESIKTRETLDKLRDENISELKKRNAELEAENKKHE